jgi:predicted neuraminidase
MLPRPALLFTAFALLAGMPAALRAAEPVIETIFPLQSEHTHGSTLVELPNGDLLAGWFQGSGERWADDVRVMGARQKRGESTWSAPFLLADVEDFPDCNPVLFIDPQQRLWLMWITIIANQWETSLIKYRISNDYLDTPGAPGWTWQDTLLVKAGDKTERGIQAGDAFALSVERQVKDYATYLAASPANAPLLERWAERSERLVHLARGEDMKRAGRVPAVDGSSDDAELGYPYFRRMGWQTRNKPFFTKAGRMIVPLYSDGFSFSLMAYTDDGGETWGSSAPLVGAGNIQPAIAATSGGDLVAYMRDNGPPPKRLHVSRSNDDGLTWSPVRDSSLPNSGTACDIVTLSNGNWVLINNDTEEGRARLTVSLSTDEGRTWTHRTLMNEPDARAHYPALIAGADGRLHATFSYFAADGTKTIRHAAFSRDWIAASTESR